MPRRCDALLVLYLVGAGLGCSPDEKATAAKSPEQTEMAAKAPGAARVDKPEEKKELRCDDFVTQADLAAEGFDASDYDPKGMHTYGIDAVLCSVGVYSFHVYADGRYSDGVRKTFESTFKNNPEARGSSELIDGPKVGRESVWFKGVAGKYTTYHVHFVAGDRGLSAMVSAIDQDQILKLAQLIVQKL